MKDLSRINHNINISISKYKNILVFIICFLLTFCIVLAFMNYKEHKQDKRILVMISSYKRPLLLSGQLIRFENQTYNNFDISVSIKGCPENYIRQTFMQEWESLIKKGGLRIRFDENKNQLANLLDTVRDINLEAYDYFCKVDDDDWYSPIYLEEVNEWLKKEDNIAISSTRNATVLRNGKTMVQMGTNSTDLSGPTMCFSRGLIKLALELETNLSAAEPYYTAQDILYFRERREDALLHRLAPLVGKVQERSTSPLHIIFGQQYPSVMRNRGYLPEK